MYTKWHIYLITFDLCNDPVWYVLFPFVMEQIIDGHVANNGGAGTESISVSKAQAASFFKISQLLRQRDLSDVPQQFGVRISGSLSVPSPAAAAAPWRLLETHTLRPTEPAVL